MAVKVGAVAAHHHRDCSFDDLVVLISMLIYKAAMIHSSHTALQSPTSSGSWKRRTTQNVSGVQVVSMEFWEAEFDIVLQECARYWCVRGGGRRGARQGGG